MNDLLDKFNNQYVLGKSDILNIISSYIKEKGLSLYLNDVIFSTNIDHLGHYNMLSNKITLNTNRIIKFCYRMCDSLSALYKIDDHLYTHFLNFFYLYAVFHELCHVDQKARYAKFMNQENIYFYIEDLCIKLHNRDINFYNNNHDLFPSEVEANNMGFRYAYNMMSHTKLPNREKRIMYLQYLNSMLINYQKLNKSCILSPIEKLSQKRNDININIINTLIKNSKLSKDERINLGLTITPREYNGLFKEEIKVFLKCHKY